MEIIWWYDNSFFDPESLHESERELYLVRETIYDDDTVELLFPSGTRVKHPTRRDASDWLLDEEFGDLDLLIEELQEENRLDLAVQIPIGSNDEELLPQMRKVLPISSNVK